MEKVGVFLGLGNPIMILTLNQVSCQDKQSEAKSLVNAHLRLDKMISNIPPSPGAKIQDVQTA